MPLPNEKPGGSVANLIGRFEHAQKRQSLTLTATRSSSVASNITGDSAKEEVKDKREWPPSSWVKPDTKPFDPPERKTSVHESVLALKDVIPVVTPTSVPVPAPVVVAAPVIPAPVPAPVSVPVPVPVHAPAHVPTPAASAPAPVTPAKRMTPLKPQHTGPTPSGRRSVASTTTPSRTPSRPKTPSSTASRSKTPSAKLPPPSSFHNNHHTSPPTRTSTHTPAFSPESADRLSKHTTASASKARDAVEPTKTPVKSAAQKARESAAKIHAEKKGLMGKPVRKPLPSTLKKKVEKKTTAPPQQRQRSNGEEEDGAHSHDDVVADSSRSYGDAKSLMPSAPIVDKSPSTRVAKPPTIARSPSPVVKAPSPIARSPSPVAKAPSPVAKPPSPIAKAPSPIARSPIQAKPPSPSPSPIARSPSPAPAPAPAPAPIPTTTPILDPILLAALETDAHPPTDNAVTLADPPLPSPPPPQDDIVDMVNMLERGGSGGRGIPVDDDDIGIGGVNVDDVREIPDEDELDF